MAWHSQGQYMGMVSGRDRRVRRGWDTVCGLGSWQDGGDRGTGSRCISPPMGAPATPHSPPQQHWFPRQDRHRSPPTAAQEGSTEGAGEGLQGLYSSHDKQAWYRGAGRGGQGACHRGRRCPSCDLGMGWREEAGGQGRGKRGFARSSSGFTPGWALACGEDRGRGCAGAGAESATSIPQANLPCCLCKSLAGLGSAPGPAGNAQHRYLQSKTELTNITNN